MPSYECPSITLCVSPSPILRKYTLLWSSLEAEARDTNGKVPPIPHPLSLPFSCPRYIRLIINQNMLATYYSTRFKISNEVLTSFSSYEGGVPHHIMTRISGGRGCLKNDSTEVSSALLACPGSEAG